MVDPILPLDHKGKIIVRMSVNPEEIINRVEFGTSRLKGRIEAINKLKETGYKVGILIAPVILLDNWKELYKELIQTLNEELSEKVKKDVFFEIIFITANPRFLFLSPSLFYIYIITRIFGFVNRFSDFFEINLHSKSSSKSSSKSR